MHRGQQPVDAKSGIAGIDRHSQRLSTERAVGAARGVLSNLAFWSAIVLPALYLPLLIDGIETVDRLGIFVGLVGLHVLALIGGRGRHVEP